MRSVCVAIGVVGWLVACASAQANEPALPAPAIGRAHDAVFAVRCHGGDDALAQATLAAVAPVWGLVAAAFGCADARPATRIDVHLYVALADYVAADRALTGGKFAPNQAMTHNGSRSSHIALQPPVGPTVLAEFGLPRQTALMLAWEAAHAARMHLCENFVDQPRWFVDGLAASTALKVLAGDADVDALPVGGKHVHRVRKLAADGRLPNAAAILGEALSGLEMHDAYALRIVFFRFLQAERPAALAAIARELRRLGGGAGYADRAREAAQTAFGADLDAAFAAWLAARRPTCDEVFRSAWPVGPDLLQIAFPETNAVLWQAPPVAGPFTARGSVRILPAAGAQLNFLCARDAHGFVSVAFVAGRGVTVLAYDAAANTWTKLGSAPAPGLVLDRVVPFTVRGGVRQLAVEVGGATLQVELPRPLPAQVQWGLGAQAAGAGKATGSAGVWRDVVVQSDG